ncbi:hypothetical protein [Pectobacterium odoriferum]|uniref:Uncharacterized protein n=1 Tax=Pectobacterium odoriferum TaxID=78398 RepID=A0ABD6VT94_9GAMM|nr:hypothetical protein [Pectobacterium odoriferum]MBA0189091.1 hypothetical protein [Pectobacterium odoriferum]MCA6961476.1 hypothetical protein [Pectobacterium odoriferum]MCH5009583.1 hypothetical protein [Pectobacterium odoriferum]POD98443.1 hypothetical protein BVY06_01740 [Pectobacterium odoriferum]POE04292.1 hypothetical protein BVY05_02810 [Pectobacterium odoriferum]
MFSLLKRFLSPSPSSDHRDMTDDNRVREIEEELAELESRLAQEPGHSETQKMLMIKYNQAIQLFSSHPDYRERVDLIFIQIDELRNTIRKNI